jgi:hypothetical protein
MGYTFLERLPAAERENLFSRAELDNPKCNLMGYKRAWSAGEGRHMIRDHPRHPRKISAHALSVGSYGNR